MNNIKKRIYFRTLRHSNFLLFRSVSEVMREALRLLVERDALKEMKLEALRRDLQEGIDSLDRGEGTPLNIDDIKAKARAIKAGQA